jgi:hypothetical protein
MEQIEMSAPAAALQSGASPQPDEIANAVRPARRQLSESLADGQIVIISARWLLVLAALLLTLWSPGPDALSDIRLRVPVLLALAVANFYLHAQVLMRRPVAADVIYAASAADIIVITLLLLAQGGFDAPLYIFYFPAILAFSVAFPAVLTAGFTALLIFLYSCISLPGALAQTDGLPVLIMRLLMLGAVAVCGQLYQQVEQRRRAAPSAAFEMLLAQTRRADEPHA